MVFDMEIVKKNSHKVFNAMKYMYRCSFEELETKTCLGCTELCMALSHLIKEGRVVQSKDTLGICYMVAKN